MHQYFIVTNNVLSSDIRNYTVNITSPSVAWKISSVHYDPGWAERRCDNYNIEHTLSQTEYPQNGAVGSAIFYQIPTHIVIDARTKRFTP